MEQAYLEKLTIPEVVEKFPKFNRKGSCSPVFTAAHYSNTSANEDNSFRNHIR